MTPTVVVDFERPEAGQLAEVRAWLDAGKVVAVPTDTVYGLAANALSAEAVARVFALKGRAETNPLPLVVRDVAQAEACAASLPELFAPLAAAFWPGPLTLLLPVAAHLPAALSAGTGAIAVRQPAAPILAGLLRLTGYPLTATSCNAAGEPAARSAAEAEAALGGRVDLIVDGGAARTRLASTLLDLRYRPPRLLREGAVPAAALAAWL